MMREILTAVTYVIVWFLCEKVIDIESGLARLIISLGSAVGVYIFMAVKERKERLKKYKSSPYQVRDRFLLETIFRQF